MTFKLPRRTLIATAAGALATGGARAQDAKPIRIGMTVSSTGTFALAAQSGLRGAEIWVDDVNSRGGLSIGGTKRKVELVKLDDRSDKTVIPKVYETLIKDEKVDLCFGPFGSTLTAAAVNATETNNKFMVIWSASADFDLPAGLQVCRIGDAAGRHPARQARREVLQHARRQEDRVRLPRRAVPRGADQRRHRGEAKKLGMEVTMNEKFAKGTKDFNILIQKAKASGADVFMPTAYEGDQMTMARQLREMNVDFKGVYFVYASQPQFLAIGKDAQYHFSQTLLNDRINWKVTGGLNRAQMMERYAKLFPNAQYPADFQTALAYGAGAVLEQILQEAQSVDAAKLKEAALKLNNKIVTVTGPYEIDETGKQFKNEFAVMQNMPNGVEVVYPAEIATAKAAYPVPPYKDRK